MPGTAEGKFGKDRIQTAFQCSNEVSRHARATWCGEVLPMSTESKTGYFRAFWTFFVLFSGISTASNLARTQGRTLKTTACFSSQTRRRTR